MRLVFLLVLIVGFGVAGVAVYLAMQQFNNYEKELSVARKSSPFKLTRVFVTNKPLRYGQKLTQADLQPVTWPVKGVPKNAFTDANALIHENTTAREILADFEGTRLDYYVTG